MKLGIWEFNWQTILIGIFTLAALILITNQAFSLIYKVQLLSSPCELCVELNPEWEQCYKEVTKPVYQGIPAYTFNLSQIENITS